MKGARRPLAVLAAAAAVWVALACLDISSPVSGITSISRIVAPTPSVVRGDSLRDTLGNLDSLHVYAFAPNGDTVRDVIVRFYAVDTSRQLHVDSVRGIVWSTSDTLVPNAAVFARVRPANGKGSLDTPPDTIPIIPKPDSATADTNFLFTFRVAGATDTTASDLISAPFGVTVRGQADTVIQKYVVGFQLVRQPKPKGASTDTTAVLTSTASANDSAYAISDASGHASLRLRVRRNAISDSLRAGAATDTAVVKFHLRYHGMALQVKPDSIIITIRSIF